MPDEIRHIKGRVEIDNSAFGHTARAAQSMERQIQTSANVAHGHVTNLGRSFGSLSVSTSGAMRAAFGFIGPLAGIAAGGVAIAGAFGLAKHAISLSSEMEQNRVAFTTFLGSEQKATDKLKELVAFAARTPFTVRGLTEVSKQLLGMGFSAEELIPDLQAIGDAVAAVGGGAETMNRVVLALGQMKAKGALANEELRQMAETGIPVYDILAKKLGITISEVQDKVSKGLLTFDKEGKLLVQGMEERFSGMMENQSKTLTGMLSNVQDAWDKTLTAIGDLLVTKLDLKKHVADLTPLLEGLDKVIKKVGEGEAPTKALKEQFGGLHTQMDKVQNILDNVVTPAFRNLGKGISDSHESFDAFDKDLQRLRDQVKGLTTSDEFASAVAFFAVTLPANIAPSLAAIQLLVDQMDFLRVSTLGTIRLMSDLLHGDFKKAWEDAKQTSVEQTEIIKRTWDDMTTFQEASARAGSKEVAEQYDVMKDRVRGTMQNMWSDTHYYGPAIGSSLALGVAAGVDQNIGATASSARWLVNHAASEAADQARRDSPGVGASMAYGIRDGFNGNAWWIGQAARQAVSHAMDEARDAIQAGSPSLLWAEKVGRPISEGIALGVSQAAPRLDAAVRQVVSPANYTTNVTNSTGPYHLTINVNGAGQNAEQIANVIDQHLSAILRSY